MKRQRAKQRPLYRYDVYRGRRRGQARLIGAAGCAVFGLLLVLIRSLGIRFSGFLLLLSIFPELAYWTAGTLGMQAPINVVYLAIIFLLILKVFFMSLRISQMDSKMKILAQKVALNEEKIERAHQDR